MEAPSNSLLSLSYPSKPDNESMGLAIESEHLLQDLIDAVPHGALVVNEHLQVLMANKSGLRWLGKAHLDNTPCLGELLKPADVSSLEDTDRPSCLTTEASSEFTSQNHQGWDEETEILDDSGHTHHIKLQARPLPRQSCPLFLVSLFDLSSSWRKKFMDQLFFHDIANTTSEILCNAEQLANPIHQRNLSLERRDEISETIFDLARELAGEIREHKALLARDSKINQITAEELHSLRELQCLKRYFSAEANERNLEILIDPESENIRFHSNPVLLRRVLMNILKNACEASRERDVITMGCELKAHLAVSFYIHNPGNFSEEAKQRFLDLRVRDEGKTKGLGTYSIKLLTERYLYGSFELECSEEQGSRVAVRYPLNWPVFQH